MLVYLNNQKGVALVTVLLIAGIVSVMALSMTSSQQIDIRRTANIIESERALWLVKGVETWGVCLLMRDNVSGGNDNLGEDWAQGMLPTGIDGAFVSGELEDLQGRININNLVSVLTVGQATLKGETWSQLTRLFERCEIDPAALYKVLDWIDPDVDAQGYGAEDEYYLVQETPYRAANRLMVSPTELRAVGDISEEGYQCLAPNISTLPYDTYINVNTVPPGVIAALGDDISLAVAEEVVDERPIDGFASIAEFRNLPQFAGKDMDIVFLTDRSEYFLATSRARVGRQDIVMYSLVAKKSDKVSVLSRSIGVY
ncbi:MAG: type II secretion system minor pseudopilin GspK [Proteobacteria bacterium]|nr:type II secretion system minor pseudopilin GspK [Pseudomonadota bacterium]MBU1716967.1 type II secretion system minor pseudopilin GspK [Pseudomonadota bacterium]